MISYTSWSPLRATLSWRCLNFEIWVSQAGHRQLGIRKLSGQGEDIVEVVCQDVRINIAKLKLIKNNPKTLLTLRFVNVQLQLFFEC